MMKKVFLLITIVTTSILFSCEQERSKIEILADEIEYAEKYFEEMGQEEWETLNESFSSIQSDIDDLNISLSKEDFKEFNRLKGLYTALILKKGVYDLQESIKGFGNQIEGLIEGINDKNN